MYSYRLNYNSTVIEIKNIVNKSKNAHDRIN